jgi:hypothetical protein
MLLARIDPHGMLVADSAAMHTVRVNGEEIEVIGRRTVTTFADRGRGLGALRVLTIHTPGTRYEGAFLMDPTAGDYGQRDRAQTADTVTAIQYPTPDRPGWPRVVFTDGSTVAAFMAPDPPPTLHLRDCDPSPPRYAPPG